ncbi:hypothetical protein [Oscillatoria acuminata]|uniref:Uncharacterized protein n=1 Tax=Oscillatoria acuminata PCC 6304 TaxID=56110 RepID=K9TRM4_9CYAN|nr:hypothetical protein [Oscillatoria acuminata]AFY85497.1 hypothetical protein Oscil6304_6038 [Oscillatoria acuminata PCC 6304]
MGTQNKRVVGYLPPEYHRRLRQYMDEQNLGESAALVQIVREFFDGRQQNPEIDSLRAQLAELQQRVAVVEAVLSSGSRRGQNSTPVMREPIKPKALTTKELAERLKVTPQEVEEAVLQDVEEFKKWSRSRDPALIRWEKRGELFHQVER